MAKNHAAAHAAFVNQTKRVATWATRVVMMRRFARKARDCMRGYARHHGLFGWDTEDEQLAGHQEIEKFIKLCKTHRCILDQDLAFATSGGLGESRRRVSARV